MEVVASVLVRSTTIASEEKEETSRAIQLVIVTIEVVSILNGNKSVPNVNVPLQSAWEYGLRQEEG
jgi:hypothetical protein